MDSHSDGNSGSGGATGDLWKKVLEEVQSEAAARRSKVGARSAAAPQRSNVEVDLLKRILAAIEARPAGPVAVDHSELLHQILDGIRHPPQLDPASITSPLLAAIEKADHDGRFKELEANLTARLQTLREAQPRPIDPTAQLEAIHEAVRQQPALDPQAILGPILAAIAGQNPQPSLDHLREEIKQQIQQAVAAAPKPADITPQLTELRQSVEQSIGQSVEHIIAAAPVPQPLDVDALVSRLGDALAAAKPADITPQLTELRQSVEQSVQQSVEQSVQQFIAAAPVPQPVDVEAIIARLHELLASSRPADIRPDLDALRQSIESQPKAQPVDVEAIIARLHELLASSRPADIRPDLDALRQMIRSLPQPADQSGKLEEILAAAKVRPDDGRDEILLQILETVQKQAAQQVLPPPVAEEIRRLPPLLEQVETKLSRKMEEKISGAVDAIRQGAADPAAIGRGIEELKQEIAGQNAQVREDMLAHSIELIDQIKAQSPPSAQELLQLLRGEIGKDLAAIVASLPQPADHSESLKARLELVEQNIVQKIAQQPLPPSIDEAALVARLREAMPAPAAPDTAALVDQIRAALPAPAKVELPQMPSYAQDFARQQEMLGELAQLVKSQAGIADGNHEATEAVRREMEKLARQQQQTHAQVESSISEFTERLETKLETKINSGLAKIELAMATSDSGRPPSITADDGESPAVSSHRYSWMNQPQPRQRTPAVALTVTAVAAVGMFLVLLINALTGNSNNSQPVGPGGDALAGNNRTPPAVTPTPPSSTAPTTATGTPATTPGVTKNDPAPPSTGPLFHTPTGAGEEPRIAGSLVAELRNLTNPTSERTRVVYELAQARQVVFLVHISGKSPTAMTTILTELKKTLADLKPAQKFTIVFSEGNRFVEAPPSGLRASSDGERNRVEGWIDLNIRGTGHRPAGSPLVALDVAASYQPDLLWIISDAIVSDEPGRVSSKEIIGRIATLNPDGSIRIAATQIGSPDTGGTLKILAEKYGGAYVVLGDGSSASLAP